MLLVEIIYNNFSSSFFLSLQKVDPELIFTKQERIGKGSFGEVFKGVDNRTQQVREVYFLLIIILWKKISVIMTLNISLTIKNKR